MKLIIILFLFICPFISFAQQEIVLSVNQSPEFGFSISNQEITIEKGSSSLLGTDLMVFGGSGEYQYLWSPSTGLNNPALLNPLATPTETISYILTVSDRFGCSFFLNYKVNVAIDVKTNEIKASELYGALLFPNPNKGEFKVKIEGPPSAEIELFIYDSKGQIIKNQIIRNFQGNHTENIQIKLVSGVYSLRINSEEKSLSRQFIIL